LIWDDNINEEDLDKDFTSHTWYMNHIQACAKMTTYNAVFSGLKDLLPQVSLVNDTYPALFVEDPVTSLVAKWLWDAFDTHIEIFTEAGFKPIPPPRQDGTSKGFPDICGRSLSK
jgi:hypothetical protein